MFRSAWFGQNFFRRRVFAVTTALFALGVAFMPMPVYGQLPPWLRSPTSPTSEDVLPRGVNRFGDIEAASVVSPFTSNTLFEIASPTVRDRSAPPTGITPVEHRVHDIEGRLKLAFLRIELADSNPRVVIETLNQAPVLSVEDEQNTRSLRIITVTEQDSVYNGIAADALAQTWQETLQQEIDLVDSLESAQVLRSRATRSAQIVLGLGLASGIIGLLYRFLARKQTNLHHRQQDEDQARNALITDATANYENRVIETRPDSQARSQPVEAEALHPIEQIANRRPMLLTSLRHQFNLQRRIQLYAALKWVLLWLMVGIWYFGIFAIFSTIPFLMRWRYWILSAPLEILLLWFLIGLAIRISHFLIKTNTIQRFSAAIPSYSATGSAEQERRRLQASTIEHALAGLVTTVLIFVGMLWTPGILGISTGSILAGSAIFGLAISFGSQSLVKDLVNGCLILVEDQFAVGDIIAIGDDAGVVESINLRITRIRNVKGDLITVPNSGITKVKNMTRLWSRVNFLIEVAYENDVDQVIHLLDKTAQAMFDEEEWRDLILEPPIVLGVDELAGSGMTLSVLIKTASMKQWVVGREYRRRVRYAFADHNVEIG